MWSHAGKHVKGLRARDMLCQTCYGYGHYTEFCPNPCYFDVGEEEESHVGAYSQVPSSYDEYPTWNSSSSYSWEAPSPSMYMQNEWAYAPPSYPHMESRMHHTSPQWLTYNHHIYDTQRPWTSYDNFTCQEDEFSVSTYPLEDDMDSQLEQKLESLA